MLIVARPRLSAGDGELGSYSVSPLTEGPYPFYNRGAILSRSFQDFALSVAEHNCVQLLTAKWRRKRFEVIALRRQLQHFGIDDRKP